MPEPEAEIIADDPNDGFLDSEDFDDLLRAKEEIKKKRDAFETSLDKDMTDAERRQMMDRFDAQTAEMERALRKEQEDQAAMLHAKLAARNKKAQKTVERVDQITKPQQEQMKDLQAKIDDIQSHIEENEKNGINTKIQKKERDAEMKERIQEFDRERDLKLQNVRDDYLQRIKEAKSADEKEMLLEEMGRRLKQMEDQLADERKRQDANLMKLLRARQKKNNKAKERGMRKEIDKIYSDIDDIKKEVESKKAEVYAEEAASGLMDEDLNKRKDRISNAVGTMFTGFQAELSKEEEDDMAIERAQMQLQKEKELKSVEVQVEEELDTQVRAKKQAMDDEKAKLNKLIVGAASDEEKKALMEQLANIDKNIARELDEEKRYQERLLDERKRRKAERMAIRKMRIESAQVEELTDKEIALNNKKFMQQMTDIQEQTEKGLDREIRMVMDTTEAGGDNEQGLVLIAETYDEVIARKLKILHSKQFFDLSKYLGTLHTQVGFEQMIKLKEHNMQFESLKEQAMATLNG